MIRLNIPSFSFESENTVPGGSGMHKLSVYIWNFASNHKPNKCCNHTEISKAQISRSKTHKTPRLVKGSDRPRVQGLGLRP